MELSGGAEKNWMNCRIRDFTQSSSMLMIMFLTIAEYSTNEI